MWWPVPASGWAWHRAWRPKKSGGIWPEARLLYEANPMSWLIEQAGGAATNGRQRIARTRLSAELAMWAVQISRGGFNRVEIVAEAGGAPRKPPKFRYSA